jgi:hypothetical protein
MTCWYIPAHCICMHHHTFAVLHHGFASISALLVCIPVREQVLPSVGAREGIHPPSEPSRVPLCNQAKPKLGRVDGIGTAASDDLDSSVMMRRVSKTGRGPSAVGGARIMSQGIDKRLSRVKSKGKATKTTQK